MGYKKSSTGTIACANVNKDMRIRKVWDQIRRINVSPEIPQEWVVLLKEKANLQEVVVSVNQIEIRLRKGNVGKTRAILENRLDH